MKAVLLFLLVTAMLTACGPRPATRYTQYEPVWPMFQKDPEHTGSTDAPAIERPVVLWKKRIGIQGYLNNPIIAGGWVFVGSSGTAHNFLDMKDGIYCLDAKTGRVLWHRWTDDDACGVAYDNGIVFSTGDDGFLRAFRADDGAPVWTVKRKGKLYSQPLVTEDLVIVGDSDGAAFACDQFTGRIVWEIRLSDRTVRGGPAEHNCDVYFSFLNGTVMCAYYEGRLEWAFNIPRVIGRSIDFIETYPAPTIVNDLVIVPYARSTYDDLPALIAVDRSNGLIKWLANDKNGLRAEGDHHANLRSSPAVWGDYLLFGEPYGNDLNAIRVDDGSYSWKVSMGAPMFQHYPSPAVAGDTLYLPRHDGGLYAVDLRNRTVKWQFYLGDSNLVGADLPENIMPEDRHHYAWEPAVGKPIYASPAIDRDGTLYIGTGEGYLYAIADAQSLIFASTDGP